MLSLVADVTSKLKNKPQHPFLLILPYILSHGAHQTITHKPHLSTVGSAVHGICLATVLDYRGSL